MEPLVIGLLFKLAITITATVRGWKGWPWLWWFGSEAIGLVVISNARTRSGLETAIMISFVLGGIATLVIIGMIFKPRRKQIPVEERGAVKAS